MGCKTKNRLLAGMIVRALFKESSMGKLDMLEIVEEILEEYESTTAAGESHQESDA